MSIKHIFLFVITFFIVSSLSAQIFKVTSYTEKDGLSSSNVFDVTQDTLGNMWFATRAGISKFDGRKWESFIPEDVPDARIFSKIITDKKGVLWALSISPSLNIFKYENNKWVKHLRFDEIIINLKTFNVIYENNVPVPIVALSDILYSFYPDSTLILNKKNKLSDRKIRDIEVIDNKLVVATTSNVIVVHKNQSVEMQYDNYNLPDNEILDITLEKINFNDTITYKTWLLGKSWAGYIYNNKFVNLTKDQNLSHIPYSKKTHFCPTNSGFIYGNKAFIHHYNISKQETTILSSIDGLPADGITSVFKDHENNIWLSQNRGIAKITMSNFTNFDQSDGLHESEISAIEEYAPGKLIFGHNSGFTFYDGNKLSRYRFDDYFKNSIPTQTRVLEIFIDSDQTIWATCGYLGIAKIDKNLNIEWLKFPDIFVSSISRSSEGKLFVGTTTGLFLLENNKLKKLHIDKLSAIRRIFTFPGNKTFIATSNYQFFGLENNELTEITSLNNKFTQNVYSMIKLHSGDYIVATFSGLYTINNNKLKPVNFNNSHLQEAIFLVFEDSQHHLWFGGDNGVYHWDGNILIHLSSSEGLLGSELNRDAGIIDSNNSIWIGTNEGLSKIENDNNLKTNTPNPINRINYIVANGDTIDHSQKIVLKHSNNNIEFHTQSISYLTKNSLRYQFILEGYNKKWSENKFYSEIERFSNLPPGEYKFSFKTQISNDKWSDEVSSPIIIINKRFSLIWWLYILGSLLTLLIMGLIIRNIIINRYSKKLVIQIKKRTSEILDTNIKLQKAKEKAVESDNLKSAFIANVSHEIRTPLNYILGFANILKEEDYSKEERLKFLTAIESGGNQLLSTISDILDISRIDSKQIKIQTHSFSLNSVIDSLYQKTLLTLTKKDISIKIKKGLSDEESIILSDKDKLIQIIQNLLTNGLKFTSSGLIEFGYLLTEDNFLQFYVKDSGTGIPAKDHQLIFDRFGQSDSNKSINTKGTGLGLSICKDLVSLFGGNIWVESEINKGSIFYFTIPYYKSNLQVSGSKNNILSSIKTNQNSTILIAEDEIDSYLFLEATLTPKGYKILHAKNGLEAIELFKNNGEIKLVLMDLKMPVMDGLEAASKIKEINPEVPIIAQTAFVMNEDRKKAGMAGCVDYLLKPIEIDTMFKLIQKYI